MSPDDIKQLQERATALAAQQDTPDDYVWPVLTVSAATILGLLDRLEKAETDRSLALDKLSERTAAKWDAEDRADRLQQAANGAWQDIRNRHREFVRLGAHGQYLLALNDALGLISNRLRDVGELGTEHRAPQDARIGDTVTVTGAVRTIEALVPEGHRRYTLDVAP